MNSNYESVFDSNVATGGGENTGSNAAKTSRANASLRRIREQIERLNASIRRRDLAMLRNLIRKFPEEAVQSLTDRQPDQVIDERELFDGLTRVEAMEQMLDYYREFGGEQMYRTAKSLVSLFKRRERLLAREKELTENETA